MLARRQALARLPHVALPVALSRLCLGAVAAPLRLAAGLGGPPFELATTLTFPGFAAAALLALAALAALAGPVLLCGPRRKVALGLAAAVGCTSVAVRVPRSPSVPICVRALTLVPAPALCRSCKSNQQRC